MDERVEHRSWIAVRGTVLPSIAPEVALYTTSALGVAGLRLVGFAVPVSPLAHSIVGIALGMLLVFRTNVSYDRYWEARQRWSGLTTAARNICRAVAHTSHSGELARLMSAYLVALRCRLQGEDTWAPLRAFVPEETIRAVHAGKHPPLALAREITGQIRILEAEGTLSADLAHSVEGYIAVLVEHQTAAERIWTTPVPFAYMTHVRQLLTIYLLTLPFALGSLGLWSIPAVAFVSFGLLGIDRAGREIEDPFGTDDNDLPLAAMTDEVVRELDALIYST